METQNNNAPEVPSVPSVPSLPVGWRRCQLSSVLITSASRMVPVPLLGGRGITSNVAQKEQPNLRPQGVVKKQDDHEEKDWEGGGRSRNGEGGQGKGGRKNMGESC